MRRLYSLIAMMVIVVIGIGLLMGCGMPGFGGGGGGEEPPSSTATRFKVWYVRSESGRSDYIAYKVYEISGDSISEVDGNDSYYHVYTNDLNFYFADTWVEKVGDEVDAVILGARGDTNTMCVVVLRNLEEGGSRELTSSDCYDLGVTYDTVFEGTLEASFVDNHTVLIAFQNSTLTFAYKIDFSTSPYTVTDYSSVFSNCSVWGVVTDLYHGFTGQPAYSSYLWYYNPSSGNLEDISSAINFSEVWSGDIRAIGEFAIGGTDSPDKAVLLFVDASGYNYFAYCNYDPSSRVMSGCQVMSIDSTGYVDHRKMMIKYVGNGYYVLTSNLGDMYIYRDEGGIVQLVRDMTSGVIVTQIEKL